MSTEQQTAVTITDAKGQLITVARVKGHIYQPAKVGPAAEQPRCSCGWSVATYRRADAGRRLWYAAHQPDGGTP